MLGKAHMRKMCTKFWPENLKMYFKEMCADWIDLAQGRVQWQAVLERLCGILQWVS